MNNAISIRNYESIHQPWFEYLNRAWIEKYFVMEDIDIQTLQDPENYILKKDGFIFMAYLEKEIAGTVALKHIEHGIYELTKMAVDEKFRKQKLGHALAKTAIEKAKSLHAQKIILYSNTTLKPALNLYRKLGFVEISNDMIYKRSDIKMELQLKN